MHGHVVTTIREVIEWAALAIELLAVTIIVASVVKAVILRGTVRFLLHLNDPRAYEEYKYQLAKPLLLALDFLVAGDLVRTIALPYQCRRARCPGGHQDIPELVHNSGDGRTLAVAEKIAGTIS
jgi:uncharacterized membrane protein